MRKLRSTLFLLLPLALLGCSEEPAEKTDPGPSVEVTGEGRDGAATTDGTGDGPETGTTEPAGNGGQDPGDSDGEALAPGSFGFEDAGKVPDSDLANYHVLMEVAIDGESVGVLTIGLWPQFAPITVRNFLRLCDEGFYDGIVFHRVLRSFMVQGGDPTGSGAGNSPYGTIKGEFSDDPERGHRYGVLSMARLGHDPDSASCQFFICNDEGMSVWNLDGQYTSFGRLVGGVAALEALSDVKVGPTVTGEPSKPLQHLTIVAAQVQAGAAPQPTEEIARPAVELDLGGEPQRITIQHCLISFKGRTAEATRTQEEAEALALALLQEARDGADFSTLVRENSDDRVAPGDEQPGLYRLLNSGCKDMQGERALFEKRREFQKQLEAMQTKYNAGEVTREEYQALSQSSRVDFQAFARLHSYSDRARMVPGFGNVGFRLEVGEVGISDFDAQASPYGWHIIKRLE